MLDTILLGLMVLTLAWIAGCLSAANWLARRRVTGSPSIAFGKIDACGIDEHRQWSVSTQLSNKGYGMICLQEIVCKFIDAGPQFDPASTLPPTPDYTAPDVRIRTRTLLEPGQAMNLEPWLTGGLPDKFYCYGYVGYVDSFNRRHQYQFAVMVDPRDESINRCAPLPNEAYWAE